MVELLSKGKGIIEHVEQDYKTTSTLKNKLWAVLKCYTILNIENTKRKEK
jgi:hypothetical protein